MQSNVIERLTALEDEAERNASMDSGWSAQKVADIADARARMMVELAPQLQRMSNVADSICLETARPSQLWSKDAIRAAAKQLSEMFLAAGIPPKAINDGCVL